VSITKSITMYINTTLPNPQMVTNNDPKYQQGRVQESRH